MRLDHYTAASPILSMSARIQRLLQYDIDIHYLPDISNVIEDALSRVSPSEYIIIKAINCIDENELSVNIPSSKMV